MQYLKKKWVRIIVSLFAGGITAEMLWLMFADNPNAERPAITTYITIGVAFVVYYFLTKRVK